MTFSKANLSDRVRPNSEVPAWVHVEILKLENYQAHAADDLRARDKTIEALEAELELVNADAKVWKRRAYEAIE